MTHGWKPESGFLPYRWEGYDEALLLYVLGLGSPTHPLPAESYQAWASTYEWKTVYDIEFLYAGPLFTHQLSHVWIDFRGIQDAFMREHGIDYFENSRRATLVQQQYAIRNPGGFAHYGELCWGITASDGPGEITRTIDGVERRFFDYLARGVPDGPDDGTIAPWAVVASLPFAPEIVLPTIADFTALEARRRPQYGFKATFNPTFPVQRFAEWLGVAVALRHQRGADRRDDRELPNRARVAIDAGMSAYRRWPAGRRIHRRLAVQRGASLEVDRPGSCTDHARIAGGPDDSGVQAAAMKALELIADGACVGLGSGRAATLFITNLTAGRTAGQWHPDVICLGIHGEEGRHPAHRTGRRRADIAIDGADEVSPNLDLVKGWAALWCVNASWPQPPGAS